MGFMVAMARSSPDAKPRYQRRRKPAQAAKIVAHIVNSKPPARWQSASNRWKMMGVRLTPIGEFAKAE
jgi:hypothetical protein